MKKVAFAVVVICALVISSCEKEPQFEINNPIVYEFERNGESTVSFSGQTARILMATELVSAINNPDKSLEDLLEMFRNETVNGEDANPFSDPELNSSTKSVKSKVAASNDFFSANTVESTKIKQEVESWIGDQVTTVFPNWNVLAEPGIAGQIADGTSVRYVNGQGLEYNQAVNKGLIGALMTDQMLNNYLSPAVLDAGTNIADNDAGTLAEGESYTNMEHKWDEAFGYLFGTATDASDPLATLGEDAFLNKYLSRVEGDSDFAGIADDIFQALKLGRAAIVAGDYEVRDEQASIVRDLISKVIAVRAVYYLQQGKNAIPASGNAFGPAFHDLSEGFGFIYSLRFTRKSSSNEAYFTGEEVDGFIAQLLEGNGFWEVTADTLDSMSAAIADKFDFTVSQAAN